VVTVIGVVQCGQYRRNCLPVSVSNNEYPKFEVYTAMKIQVVVFWVQNEDRGTMTH
jgi:hypothetical protein